MGGKGPGKEKGMCGPALISARAVAGGRGKGEGGTGGLRIGENNIRVVSVTERKRDSKGKSMKIK